MVKCDFTCEDEWWALLMRFCGINHLFRFSILCTSIHSAHVCVCIYLCFTFFTVMFTFHLLVLSAPKWYMYNSANINFLPHCGDMITTFIHGLYTSRFIVWIDVCWCADVRVWINGHFLTFSGSGWWTIKENRLYSVINIDQ